MLFNRFIMAIVATNVPNGGKHCTFGDSLIDRPNQQVLCSLLVSVLGIAPMSHLLAKSAIVKTFNVYTLVETRDESGK